MTAVSMYSIVCIKTLLNTLITAIIAHAKQQRRRHKNHAHSLKNHTQGQCVSRFSSVCSFYSSGSLHELPVIVGKVERLNRLLENVLAAFHGSVVDVAIIFGDTTQKRWQHLPVHEVLVLAVCLKCRGFMGVKILKFVWSEGGLHVVRD
jgi:hypothetical protein